MRGTGGVRGSMGDRGDTGEPGLQGDTGPAGLAGNPGAGGSAGFLGNYELFLLCSVDRFRNALPSHNLLAITEK